MFHTDKLLHIEVNVWKLTKFKRGYWRWGNTSYPIERVIHSEKAVTKHRLQVYSLCDWRSRRIKTFTP